MQSQDTGKSAKIVSLFDSREKQKAEAEQNAADLVGEESFTDVVAKNMKNKERLEKERANANKSVLRSYRIKH